MFYIRIVFCFLFTTSIIRASHFRGGYLSWTTLLSNATNGTNITINLQQTYSWTYTRYPCTGLVGDATYLNCISSSCSNYLNNRVTIQAPCISYDVGLDISTGHSITPVTLLPDSRLILMYTSTAWLALVQSTSSTYSLVTTVDLRVRSDNGRINSSPTSTMIALVTILVNVQQTLRIPMADIDSDIVKCRWANQTSLIGNTTVNECQGVCENIPGAQLYTSSNTDNNCTLTFTTASVGYYVVALQIEDFMPTAPNGPPLSSTPLQFLVYTVNVSCDQPSIIGQLADGTTVQVQANNTVSIDIIAKAGCNTTSINRFLTIIVPDGSENTTAVTSLGDLLYSVTFIWTPTDDQIGTSQLFCIVAVDTNNLQSPQYCLTFVVIPVTTTTNTTVPPNTTIDSLFISTSTISSTIKSSTTSSTIKSSTTSSTIKSSTDNQSIDLGLILGLGIPLFLFSSILATCIACRWLPVESCNRLRQRFWNDNQTPGKQSQSPNFQKSSMNNQKVVNDASRQYRQQYINEKSISPSRLSFYNDSFLSNSTSSVNTQSISTTRTSLLSSYSHRSLPDVEISTSVLNPIHSFHSIHSGSILIHNYFQQQGRNSYPL